MKRLRENQQRIVVWQTEKKHLPENVLKKEQIIADQEILD